MQNILSTSVVVEHPLNKIHLLESKIVKEIYLLVYLSYITGKYFFLVSIKKIKQTLGRFMFASESEPLKKVYA